MTKCDYCGEEISEFIYLNGISVLYRGKCFANYDEAFCSKKCLISFISDKCREIGIKSEEEEVWE